MNDQPVPGVVSDTFDAPAPEPRVNIRFDGDVSIRLNEAMPDWIGAPEALTPDVVKAYMEEGGSKSNVLNDWCLTPDLRVYVSIGNGPEVEVWP